MKRYNHDVTIELLKKHNPVFFKNAKFHGDKSYEIIRDGARDLLKIDTELTGIVYYEISKGLRLSYTTLKNN